MKLCSKCATEKEFDFFSKSAKNKDGFFPWCKTCMATYERERYQNGDKARKERNKVKLMEQAREYIWKYLCNNSCVDCGETDALVLEFDHKDDVLKLKNISEMQNFSIKKIQLEIDKCDVRCANCHRRRTIKQFGLWRGSMVQ